jgi:hypothetical protein
MSGLTDIKVVGKALRFDLWFVSSVSEEFYDSVFWVMHNSKLMSSWNIYQECCQKMKSRKLDIFYNEAQVSATNRRYKFLKIFYLYI